MGDLFDLPFEEEQDQPTAQEPPTDGRLRATPAPPHSSPPQASPRPASPPSVPPLPVPERVGEVVPAALARPIAAPHERDRAPRRRPGASSGRALTVGQLTAQIRHLLESELFEVWVEGELSNCRLWNTGHLYFTLKDSSAQIKGVIFRSSLRYLRFKPEDGLKVVARGRVSVYDPKGEYQLVCEHLEPQGLGALQLAFEQLKARLQEEGLFDPARKRPLPALPRKIGLVTSTDGAAIRDILKVLARRHSTAHIVIRPARVQGEGASVEIARGLKALGHVPGVDVIIVGRGGGSIEDLWSFNEEIVARAITLCPVPVISAVGHETDVTIADFVADLRAPTPSAAAEMVIAAKDEFRARIDRLADRLRTSAVGRLRTLGRRLQLLTSRPALAGLPSRVANRGRHVAELSHALAHTGRLTLQSRERHVRSLERRLRACDLRQRLAHVRTRLVGVDGRGAAALTRRLHRATTQLRECAGRLESLSPLAVLGRGYAVCWNADRTRIIRAATQATPGDRVRVTLAEGELDCDVRDTILDSAPRVQS
ncbi:MAG: exodeoxyribonuclease VII large subunit [Acidimicrobiia bacterium]|nr:exodeoxyribonuclease VII large subunit [Acidimicrobiia bacterium]